MLRVARMVFFGIPQEALQHTLLLVHAKPEVLTREDREVLAKITSKTMTLKVAGLLGAGYAASIAQPVAFLGPDLVTKAAVFLLLFRCMSVPLALKVESVARVISEKHDLINRPDLLLDKDKRFRTDVWKTQEPGQEATKDLLSPNPTKKEISADNPAPGDDVVGKKDETKDK